MVTDTVGQTETGGGLNREELVSQLSMFRRKFPELSDLPQAPTAGHILDSCSLTLHGNTLSHDLWCLYTVCLGVSHTVSVYTSIHYIYMEYQVNISTCI